MKTRLLALIGLLAGIIAVAALVLPSVDVRQLAEHELALRRRIDENLPWSLLVGYVIYSLVSLVPGTSGKSIIFGWLFGFYWGLLVVVLGLTTAAMIVFTVTRFAIRDAVQQRFGPKLASWEKWLEREGAWFLLTLRMAHMPYSVVNYLSAASNVRAWTFAWTTAIGLLPGSAIFVWMGSRLPTLHELIEHGPRELLDPGLWAALFATASLPIIMRWLVHRTRRWTARSQIDVADPDIDELASQERRQAAP